MTLNISGKLALIMAAGRLFGWLIVGMALGLVYKPAKTARTEHRESADQRPRPRASA